MPQGRIEIFKAFAIQKKPCMVYLHESLFQIEVSNNMNNDIMKFE